MAGTQHVFPKFQQMLGAKAINLTSDTLKVGLIASGTFTWGATPQGYSYVSQFLAGDGAHGALTEVSPSGTGYARYSLISPAYTTSGEVGTLTCPTNPSWASATFSTVYGFLYDSTVGSADSGHPIICYWDWGSVKSPSAEPFTITISASGLLTWTLSLPRNLVGVSRAADSPDPDIRRNGQLLRRRHILHPLETGRTRVG